MQLYPGITTEEVSFRQRFNPLRSATRFFRLSQDYLRYLDPIYAQAPKLRARAGSRLPASARRLFDWLGSRPSSRQKVAAVFSWLDKLIPAPRSIISYLRSQCPDVVMVTPLVGLGSMQPDYIKACGRIGLRSCLPVASWDNLTNKGLVHFAPDRVLVWNEPQRQEAVSLHGLAPESVIVTGAHTYDHWFEWKPNSTPEAFKRKVGLDPEVPFVLYLGSSKFIAPDETSTILRWAKALRSSGDDLLKQVGILIRPHPQNAGHWEDIEFSSLGNIAVYPPKGANAIGKNSKSDYYDSMFHCSLAIGINTSGMIEAGILGKGVYTVLFEEARETQEGTLHFHHLTSANGLLHISRTLEQHIAMLGKALRKPPGVYDERSRRFTANFVRQPRLEEIPTRVFADSLEQLASSKGQPGCLLGEAAERAFRSRTV
jgi:hypothetical protein